MEAFPCRFHFAVSASEAGKRLDVILSGHLHDCSRSYAAQLIQQGDVHVNQRTSKPSYRAKPGDAVAGTVPPPETVNLVPEPIDLNILFEDSALLVINKPAGLVVHPAPGHHQGTLVNALLNHCGDLGSFRGIIRPGIVHRLDKDTSGALVVAKTPAAHEQLSGQFKARSVKKTYLAIVKGEMKAPGGDIILPIGRHPTVRKKMSTIAPKARSAETHYRVREILRGATLLELDLKTGRTHQIRVHCAAIHHPVLGDGVYGGRHHALTHPSSGSAPQLRVAIKRQMLHAWRLGFSHPVDGHWLNFEADPPEDMKAVLADLR
jgi:23S rRNA pseudouridine1911/1915/1917 synthase